MLLYHGGEEVTAPLPHGFQLGRRDMPTWNPPPSVAVSNAMGEAWQQLNGQIENAASLEEVVGMSQDELSSHAVEAVAAYVTQHEEGPGPLAMIHVYCLGFVVGSKYGEQRAKRSPD